MITYKDALELLKSESPVYYKDRKQRKITGVTWRRDPDCIYATVEVLDESKNSIDHVRLDDVFTCDDEIEAIDSSQALLKINDLVEILDEMKACFVYEDVDLAKDTYNKLMRGCITLDKEISVLSNDIDKAEVGSDVSDDVEDDE